MNDFCKKLIVNQTNLSEEDLDLLEILNVEYDVLECKKLIFNEKAPIAVIVSELIANVLPYKIATTLFIPCTCGLRILQLVFIQNNKINVLDHFSDNVYIQKEVAKMNSLIEYRMLRQNEG